MRLSGTCAALALAAAARRRAFAQSGEITIWSWNIAASSLEVGRSRASTPSIPDVKVTVEDLGNQQVFDKTLAGCAAGGEGLPDMVSIENHEAEIFWAQFPDCFANLQDARLHRRDRRGLPRLQAHRARGRRRGLRDAVGLRPGGRCSTAATSTRRPASIPRRSRPGTISSPPARRCMEANPGVGDDPGRPQRRHRVVPHDRQRAGLRLFLRRRPVDHRQPARPASPRSTRSRR